MKKLLASVMLVAFVAVTSAAYAGTPFQAGGGSTGKPAAQKADEDKDKDKDKKDKKGKKGHKGGKKGKKGSGGSTTPPPK